MGPPAELCRVWQALCGQYTQRSSWSRGGRGGCTGFHVRWAVGRPRKRPSPSRGRLPLHPRGLQQPLGSSLAAHLSVHHTAATASLSEASRVLALLKTFGAFLLSQEPSQNSFHGLEALLTWLAPASLFSLISCHSPHLTFQLRSHWPSFRP